MPEAGSRAGARFLTLAARCRRAGRGIVLRPTPPGDEPAAANRRAICRQAGLSDPTPGAAPNRMMAHLAVQRADEAGRTAAWQEHVADTDYAGGTKPGS